jgi:phosphopantothenoylcysteine decarboxylase/phosphopantothenate--cysteine ligase
VAVNLELWVQGARPRTLGAAVAPVMTEDATRFLGEVTLSSLATEPVRKSLWDEREPIPHTHLGQWADLVLVAPATARLIGAYAGGLSDDLLTATLLATRAPVVVCPAMHTEMWEHPAVQDNVAVLRRRGVGLVGPGTGSLAGGDVGPGRLAEVDDILAAVDAVLASGRDLEGVRVVVTAGGTREPLDPVRFFGNRSSGKQGHALADEAAARGASVTLVTAAAQPEAPGVEVVRVETAEDMEEAVLSVAAGADVVLMAAAVSDFRPKVTTGHKLKRSEGTPEVVLEPTPDILAALGEGKGPGQVLVGFAAETSPMDGDEMRREALDKLRRKHLDLVVANDVLAPGAGFGHDTNAVLLLGADGSQTFLPLTDKRQVARVVIDTVAEIRKGQQR